MPLHTAHFESQENAVEALQDKLAQVVVADTPVPTGPAPPEEVDVHVDAFLHGRDLGEEAPDVEEGLDVAPAQDRGEPLAGDGQCREAAAHLHFKGDA